MGVPTSHRKPIEVEITARTGNRALHFTFFRDFF